jgi:recombinational DNA repair protein (RecF pathway)
MQFDRCRVCTENQAEAAAVYFIIGRGGIVCARCRESVPEGGIRLSAASTAALVELGRMPLAAASAATAAGADGALAIARFIASVVDRKLRSVEFLDSVIAPATRA